LHSNTNDVTSASDVADVAICGHHLVDGASKLRPGGAPHPFYVAMLAVDRR
jgi:hypothetical protein